MTSPAESPNEVRAFADSVNELSQEEQRAQQIIDSAKAGSEHGISLARKHAQEILEKAREQGAREKAGKIADAQERTNKEAKAIIARAEEQAKTLKSHAAQRIPRAVEALYHTLFKRR